MPRPESTINHIGRWSRSRTKKLARECWTDRYPGPVFTIHAICRFCVLRIIDTWVSICIHRAISVPTRLISRLIRLCDSRGLFREAATPYSFLLCDNRIQRTCPIFGRSRLRSVAVQRRFATRRRRVYSSYQSGCQIVELKTPATILVVYSPTPPRCSPV